MIPKRTSDTRSMGSKIRFDGLVFSSDIAVVENVAGHVGIADFFTAPMMDFFPQSVHPGGTLSRLGPKIFTKTAKNRPVDRPHIRMPVSASMPPTRRHSARSTRSP